MNKDKDYIISLQRKKLEELSKLASALEQENALLKFQLLAKKHTKKAAPL